MGAQQHPDYQRDKTERDMQNSKLDNVKKEKQEKQADRDRALKKMNDVWTELMSLKETRSQKLDEAKSLQKQAQGFADKYRDVERKYLDYMKEIQKVEEEAAKKNRNAA